MIPARRSSHAWSRVPARILYDSTKEVWLGATTLNPAFADFAAHHGCALRCRAYRPRAPKGKVERAIGYVEESFLRGSSFADIDDLNAHAAAWVASVADARIHATTGERPAALLPRDREAMTPLSSVRPYAFVEREPRKVGAESTVRFAAAARACRRGWSGTASTSAAMRGGSSCAWAM